MALQGGRWRGSGFNGRDNLRSGGNWRGRGSKRVEQEERTDLDRDDDRGINRSRATRCDRVSGNTGRGRGRGMPQVCRFVQRGQNCAYGKDCRYSHDMSTCETKLSEKHSETLEQQRERQDYNSWKHLIKRPPVPSDVTTMKLLWTGALKILDEGDRERKQMLPRDLDNDQYFGRDHIQVLMSMKSRDDGCGMFVELAEPFISVITHGAMLDCLSVDTFVGGVYNFISGSNGTRAIPFFQDLCKNLNLAYLDFKQTKTSVMRILTKLATALRELLKREQRAAFNEDLPDLISSLEDVTGSCGIDRKSADFGEISNQCIELRAIVARANGLLAENDTFNETNISTTTVKSTYPKDILIPVGRHDNDNVDITKIKIFPTEDEIRSELPEFIPPTDFDQPHFLNDPVERHIDSQFRLLRHDVFGEMKDALWRVMDSVSKDSSLLNSLKFAIGDMRAYSYANSEISYIDCDHRRGMEASVSFDQLPALQKMSKSNRCTWWADSNRLKEGSLLCFVYLNCKQASLLFLTISEKVTDPKADWSLGSHQKFATTTAKLVTHDPPNLERLTQLGCNGTKGVLIEFPGIIAATFVPVLENLQTMQNYRRFPFRQWILPERHVLSSGPPDIRPPLYARESNFLFSLDSILERSGETLVFDPRTSPDDVACLDALEKRTLFDREQCRALIAALSREFALIQGPPGTGKSFVGVRLMRILLECKSRCPLGPIIVVCYTNHALDQFLEHLVKVGIEKIVRIGGQSKSTILEGKNLRTISKCEEKTRSEGYQTATAYRELESNAETIKESLRLLHSAQKAPEWAHLKNHLRRNYPYIISQFSRFDTEGFQLVGEDPFTAWRKGKPENRLDCSTVDAVATTREELVRRADQDVHSLLKHERRQLVDAWVEEIITEQTSLLFEAVSDSSSHQDELQKIHDEVDRRVLQTADVIGVTTTGLAKRISVLRHVQCKVVICEEAGEVMEPHMLSALLPSVEHFIQIGDHQQLRPQINNFNLSLESKQGILYQLDRSQFERLSVGEPGRAPFPLAQLNVQRRMRPEISTLIRETVYPKLTDHDDVKNLPDVAGMRDNVFWLDHRNLQETSNADQQQKSHSNDWEVEMTHALVRHIVRQGIYSTKDITVLTPYTGQLKKLRTRMQNEFEVVLSDRDEETLARDGLDEEIMAALNAQAKTKPEGKPLEKKKLSELLRIATVDNFQGEESKIVIISLVRSNDAKKVGFLRTTNRINVLLSRAQHGLYLIGNTETYSNVPMWARVVDILHSKNSIGTSFGLCCPRHTNIVMSAAEPLDFDKVSPEGGCTLPCNKRLNDCGHKCLARCHSEGMHKAFKCPQPCRRLHTPCNHLCQKPTCGEDCGLCMIKLDNISLPCGHLKHGVLCHQTQDLGSIVCSVSVQKQVPGCNHVLEVPCSSDLNSPQFICPTPCETFLPCGHRCSGTCGKCNLESGESEHQRCTKICGRRHGACNHTCPKLCHDGTDCGLCLSRCEVRCSHSRCVLYCHETCAPCIERCNWSCEHKGGCEMPCGAPCDRLPCNQRCSKMLSCGHRCPGICGEECAEGYCHQCSDKLDARVDFLEMKLYEEIDVDETPIVVLGCKHFFTAESLDGLMNMSEVYEIDGRGEFTSLRDVSGALARAIPTCPDCNRPVRQYATQRYNRVINRAVIDEMSKRFLTAGKHDLGLLEKQVIDLEQTLSHTREEVLSYLKNSAQLETSRELPGVSGTTRTLHKRYKECRKLELTISEFRKKTKDKNQPAQKLHEAIIHAQKAAKSATSLESRMTELTLTGTVQPCVQDRRVAMGGELVQLKTECIALSDKFSIKQATKKFSSNESLKFPDAPPELLAVPFLQQCNTFIDKCYSESLPKLAVESTILYARITYSLESCGPVEPHSSKAVAYRDTAKTLLEKAREACTQEFQDAQSLSDVVEQLIHLMRSQWYEEVTQEELDAIKMAMVSGSRGIATHSGHWYNCVNGHPFAIGECGMPMELARCPECGARIGGQGHEAVEGVTRAENMEA